MHIVYFTTMLVTRTFGLFIATCIWINIVCHRGDVECVSVSLSKNPDQVEAGSTLSLTCSVDEDPNPLALVQFQRNNLAIVVVSPVATCYKVVVGSDDPAAYTLTCDPNNRWFRLDILNVDSNSHGDNWRCDMISGAGGPCLGNRNPCYSGSASVFIPVPVTNVRLTDNNDNSVTSPVDVSESSNGLTLKCNTGPAGSRPVADITWWKTRDYVSPESVTVNVTALPTTPLGNDTFISNTKLVVGDRSYNRLKIYCTASQVMSGEVQLNVKWRPDVLLQIGGQSYNVYKVLESQTNVVFTCTPGQVNPAITGYSWQHNSNAIVNERTNIYTISSVSQSHDGMYTCSATNLEGTGTSVEKNLDVLYEPSVDAMAAVFLEKNERLYKTCTGRGNPSPSFHWTLESQQLSDNAVLEIGRISSDQSGIYTCHASNTLDPSAGTAVDKTTSTTLSVTVYYGPKNVNVSPLNLGIEEGQRTTTSAICSADCKPTCEYRWYKNGETNPVVVGNTLYLGIVNRNKAGNYICEAYNRFLNRNRSQRAGVPVQVQIYFSPEVKLQADQNISPPPTPYRVLQGQTNVRLRCVLDQANPQPTSYTWMFNSTEITGENQATFNIQNVELHNHGTFGCRANNGIGTPSFSYLQVDVQYGPKNVNVSPRNLRIEEGQITTTPAICSADCKPTCEYRWYKHGETHPVVVGNTLDLGIVNRNKAGNYTCEAHNQFLNRNRSQRAGVPVQVQIYFSPEVKLQADQNISPQPTPYRILLGQTNVRLRCVFYQANPQPTSYTWMFNSTEIIGETDATFNIQNVALQNHGTFGCRANNGIRTPTFSYLKVDVQYGPIITPINNQTQEEGSQLTMPCQFTANPPANISRWSKKHNSTFQNNQATLTIAQLDRTDRGLYICYIQNTLLLSGGPSTGELKTSSEDMYLDVQYKPTITSLQINRGNVISENDSDTTIVCEVDSNPDPGILWTRGRNHSSLPDTGKSLLISRAQCSDTTLFTCTANNGVGLTVRKSVPLYVNCQPRINPNNPPATTVYGAIGESINVTVHDIIAYPPPTFTWKKLDTDRLPPSDHTNTNSSSTLTLHQLELSTFGNYSVTMDNTIGNPFTVYIAVESATGHPLEPTNLAVITSTTNSVTLTWTPGFNGAADQTFHIQYQKAGDVHFVNHSKTFPDDLSISMSGTIAGLQESTVYNFRLISRNRYGDSPVSEGVQGTTVMSRHSGSEGNTGEVVGGTLGGIVAGVVLTVAAGYVWHYRRGKNTKRNSSTNSPGNETSSDHASPVYTNLELGTSTERRTEPTYQDLIQDRSVSTSEYQTLHLSDNGTPVYLDLELNATPERRNGPLYQNLARN